MFTLRKLNSKGVELNFILGDSYTLIHKERNPKEFERNNELFKFNDNIYALVYGLDASNPHLISSDQDSYIMVNGKTVDVINK